MNKEDILRKLKALSEDDRGNANERKIAEERLNELIAKYNIDPNSINTDKLVKREFYFKEEWEKRLIGQTIYKLFPEKDIYKFSNKRNWLWCEMTDAEYLEFETHYCAYKSSFEYQWRLFFTAFISKNKIFPDEDKIPEDKRASGNELSRKDRMRAAMMMEGIESAQVRKWLNEGE